MKFTALCCLLIIACCTARGQDTAYGNNAAAGKYIQVPDARLYYEVYGSGQPLVLLHGGFFGYIDEYAAFIPELSRQYKVIAVATRGHGKSEVGTQKYTEGLFAEDVIAILDAERADSAAVLGFSSGAITALYLAAHYPARISKVVMLAGSMNTKHRPPGRAADMQRQTYADYKARYPQFFAGREQLMPDPKKAPQWLEQLKGLWLAETMVETSKVKEIRCPVLVVAGDRDEYNQVEGFVDLYRTLPNARLSIIPGCNHTCLIFNPAVMRQVVYPFLQVAVP